MEALTLSGIIDSDGHLRLDVSTQLPPGQVELVLVINLPTQEKPTEKKYDFSDLAGRLNWQDDPVSMQRRLRDEW
jgi:hypothetical protein